MSADAFVTVVQTPKVKKRMFLLVIYSKMIVAGYATQAGRILVVWKYSTEVQYKRSRMNGTRESAVK